MSHQRAVIPELGEAVAPGAPDELGPKGEHAVDAAEDEPGEDAIA